MMMLVFQGWMWRDADNEIVFIGLFLQMLFVLVFWCHLL